MTFRRGIFWTHLISGLVCGLIIALMAATGAIYAFQGEILSFARRDVALVAPAETPRVPLDDIMGSVRRRNPDTTPSGLVVYADPAAATQVMMGREKPSLYANPYTGEIKDDNAVATGEFLAFSLRLHRWLALGGDGRAVGKAITGACSTAFLVLSLTGLYLWWPRHLTLRALRPSTSFIRGARGKTRDWNWHNVFGFWSLPLLILLSSTGMVMSYRWANNLLYLVAGETPPPARAEGPGEKRPEGMPGANPEGAAPAKSEESPRAAGGESAPRIAPPEPGARLLAYDALLARAGSEVPDWESISFRMQAARAQGARGASRPQREREGESASAGAAGEEPRRARREASENGATSPAAAPATASGEEGERPRRRRNEETSGTAPAGDARSESRGEGRRQSGAAPVSVIIRRAGALPLTANVTLTLNPYTGDVIKREGFADKSLGNKLRGSTRSVHTGEAFGIPGQILMFLASLAALVLVYTGFALSWRRFFPGKKQRHHQHRGDSAPADSPETPAAG